MKMERRPYQQIAKLILKDIEQGEILPGQRLPGERQLADRYDVTRTIIREAEISLETLGYLTVKTGSGVYVNDVSESVPGVKIPRISAFDLTEARALIEGETVALAASVISNADLEVLEQSIIAMTNPGPEDPGGFEADRAFHMAIARATRNNAIVYIIDLMWRVRRVSQASQPVYQRVCEQGPGNKRVDDHQGILDALRNGDPEQARLAMRDHFSSLMDAMLTATEEEEVQALQRKMSASRARFSASFGLK